MDDTDRYCRASFAAGCFWDVEAAFRRMDGIIATVTGYTGGTLPEPTYEQVGNGTSGHAEAVSVIFDPAIVSYNQLLEAFFAMHDPTGRDRQGDYTGPQYRSAIFYHDDDQRSAAIACLERIRLSGTCGDAPILTAILPATAFWPAEECHQQFYEKCGQSYCTSRQIDE